MEMQEVVNICRFCFSPGTTFYQSGDCIEPPMHVRFDGASELGNALKKVLKFSFSSKNNVDAEKPKDVCVRCNEKFQQIYTFMDRCSKDALSPAEETVIRSKKLSRIASGGSIGHDSQLHEKEDHSGDTCTKSCEGSQISRFKIKKAIVRLKRLKMVTFAINVTVGCDSNLCADNFAYEANPKAYSKIIECPKIEDIKSEILEDIHTQGYQVMETLTASRSLVQRLLPKEESIGNANTSHSALSFEQSGKELHKNSKLKQSSNIRRRKHRSFSNKQYKCDQCEKIFTASHNLKEHLRSHAGKNIECDQCNAYFSTLRTLRYHKSKDHRNERYKCDQCEKNFNLLASLKRHILIHQNINFPCDLCGKTFSTKSYMLLHKRLHTGKTLNCSQCDQRFIRPCLFRKHVAKCKEQIHTIAVETSQKFQENIVVPVLSVIRSEAAGNRFPETGDKVEVGKIEVLSSAKSGDDSNGEWLHDDLIDKNIVESSVEGDSKINQRVSATRELSTEETVISLPCLNVAAGISEEKLSQHSDSIMFYKCKQCHKSFATSFSLKRHLLGHQNVTFPCDLCDRKFATKSYMINHRRLHTGETFNCGECERRFTRESALKKHLDKWRTRKSHCRQ